MKAVVFPDYTGTNPYQRELATSLEARGVDVRLVESHGPFTPLAAVATHGLPDVVHVHWLHPLLRGSGPATSVLKSVLTLVQLALLRVLDVRLVWTVHNVTEHEETSPRVEVVFRHLIGRICDVMITHCPAATAEVFETYRLPDDLRARSYVVEHGHYIDSYENRIDRPTARNRLALDEGQTILYFGRVSEYKNVTGLVESFRRLEDPTLNLVIAGSPADDKLGDRIRGMAAADDRIETSLEFVPEDDVQVYFNAADVVVVPFRQVLSSGSVVLAMSFGRAVLVPSAGCVPALLADAGGFTYDPDGAVPLHRELRRVLDADLESAGRANRAKAECLDWDRIARRTHRIYRDAPVETETQR